MADDDWAKAIEEQEGNKIASKVGNLNITSAPAASGGAIPKQPPQQVTASGDGPQASGAVGGGADEDEKVLTAEEISLLQKALHKKLVTSKADLEVLQKDPNSPLYSVKSFEALNLKPELLNGIYEMGFHAPSKIQETALPTLLADPPQNMIAQSQSGTGKTAAFVLTMLMRVNPALPYTQCLCIAPTYELALQIGENTTQMAKHMKDVKIGFAIRGGERVQRGQPLPYHIVIGTPGTMLDYVTKLRVIDPKKISVFVLDEADVMIGTQGHQDQSIRIVKVLAKCQMLLFSATYDSQVMKFAQAIVPNPVNIRLRREEESLENIKQYFINCHDANSRFQALSNIYGTISIGQSMIFCRTKKTASWLAERMTGDGHAVALLSGELTIEQRAAVINRFRDGKEKVLITTNVSARGLDIEQVTLVVNFDLPTDMQGKADCETYLHRIGRTGRFGKSGIAINFIDGHKSMQVLQDIERHFGRKIEKLDAEDADAIEKLES